MTRYVADLPYGDQYIWITDQKEIAGISEIFKCSEWYADYDSMLILVENGEYKEIYGCVDSVPYLNSLAEVLVRNGKCVHKNYNR